MRFIYFIKRWKSVVCNLKECDGKDDDNDDADDYNDDDDDDDADND